MTPRLDALLSFRGVFAAALLYGAVNAALTLAAGPALALDDVKLNVLTQSLQGGYLPDNPPLFEWTLYAAQLALGPTLLSFAAVKTLFLVLTAAFTFLAAKEASGDARTAAAAALALPLIPSFGLSFHQTLTHSTALFAATAFFWFALLRLRRRQGFIDFALLGAAVGAGFLAKYSFMAAVGAAFIAAMLRSPARKALLSPKTAIVVLAAAAVAAPHLNWAATMHLGGAEVIRERFSTDDAHITRAVKGVLSVIWAIISFLSPMAVVAITARRGAIAVFSAAGRSILSDAALLSVAGVVAAAVAFGIPNFQERYAIPFLYPAFLWLAAAPPRSGATESGTRTFVAMSFAVVAIFASARALEVGRPGKPFCDNCRQHIPYTYLKAALRQLSSQEATLIGYDDHTAGNLRRLFPDARVFSSHQPFYTPPPAALSGGCYFIWSTDLSPPPAKAVIDEFDRTKTKRAGGAWRHALAGEPQPRTTTWSIAAIDRRTAFGAALCRD